MNLQDHNKTSQCHRLMKQTKRLKSDNADV